MDDMFNDATNVYEAMPAFNGANGMDQQHMQKMEALKQEGMDMTLWAAAQNLALSKMKLFHTLAKDAVSQQ